MSAERLEERAFQEAMAAFKRKTERIQSDSYPVIKDVYENQGNIYQFILIPITDGRHVVQLRVNLKEAYDTQSKNVVKEFEKFVVLHTIDDDWKENLRQARRGSATVFRTLHMSRKTLYLSLS